MSSWRTVNSPFARPRQNQRFVRIEPVMDDLRFDRVGVGRERRLFHQDLAARFRRPIKRRHHQVEIHRQAVHADDFVRLGADQPRRRFAQRFVIGIPGRRRARNGRRPPSLAQSSSSCSTICSRRFRHQAERIAGEINQRLAVRAERKMKFSRKWRNGSSASSCRAKSSSAENGMGMVSLVSENDCCLELRSADSQNGPWSVGANPKDCQT